MGTRYGRKVSDGTTEYYDSKEQLRAAERKDSEESLRVWFALAGLVLGGLFTYTLTQTYADWPKVVKFILIVFGGFGGAFVLARLAVIIFNMVMLLLVMAVLTGIGLFIWEMV